MRPPSPSVRLLTGSNDVKSAINLVISQVASNDVLPSIQALAQVSIVSPIQQQLFVKIPQNLPFVANMQFMQLIY